MKKLRVKGVFVRLMILIVGVVFVFVVSKINFDKGNELQQIYGSFIGQKSPYNGMIEVWNIDSFESGLKSKVSYLENVARKFQSKNKGVYVMVRNLTIGECENSLISGNFPDMISCSYGFCDKLKEYFVPFSNYDFDVFENFLNAGKGKNGELYGLAWCFGFYSLISTKSKLEKANQKFEDVKLNEIAFDSGYKYKSGKKERESKSLVFGVGDYLMPKNALNAYNKSRSIQINETSENELQFKSQYSAYTSFLSNDATILLGTQRDVFRMMNREEKAKVRDVVYLPILEWTDLIQFSFLCKNDNLKRKEMAEKFAEFLVEKGNQEKIEEIGLLSVCDVQSVNLKGVMRDITPQKFKNSELQGVFL